MDNDIQKEILERIVRIETKIDSYNSIREKAETALSKSMQNEKDVGKVEGSLTWLWRTFVGAIIVGFVATFINWR